jgi:hypothetical protein
MAYNNLGVMSWFHGRQMRKETRETQEKENAIKDFDLVATYFKEAMKNLEKS